MRFCFGTMGKNFVSGTASDQNQRMNSRYLQTFQTAFTAQGGRSSFLSCENGEGKENDSMAVKAKSADSN